MVPIGRSRARSITGIALALLVHVAVIAWLSMLIGGTSTAHGAPDHHAQPTVADEGYDTRDPYIDLTPPEVRSIGGTGALAEDLDAPLIVGVAIVPDEVRGEVRVLDLALHACDCTNQRPARAPPGS